MSFWYTKLTRDSASSDPGKDRLEARRLKARNMPGGHGHRADKEAPRTRTDGNEEKKQS